MPSLATEPSKPLPVLVLGAGGFIGRHMVAGLAAAGLPVLAGLRRPGKGPAGVEARLLDATRPESLAAALDGAGAVVNCVAAEPAAMLDGVRALAQAAGARRIVHLSSMAVYGGVTGLVDESAPLSPDGAYGESKAEAERQLREHAAAGGEVVMLRPGCVHGPGSEGWTARPARLLGAGRLGDLGPGGDGTCNLTAVADLVGATIAALRRTEAAGEAFNVSDPDPGDWNAYFLHLARAIGATPLRRIPGWRLKAEKLAAYPLKVAEIGARRLGVRTPDPIPPSLLRLFGQEITLDHRRADAGLGFPRTPPGKAIAEAAAWFLRTA
ncbi:NAD-dependent epimerase/dehydratase family protein [Pararoseomonas indoligenes]|uniref:NAD-dependent epimerase/dehydratase family protein n=1 Tax=Roseomonas indoligenes TaxID=2820811 RepID=A0A940S717_9PROT|nr:NAD-dependent epimerase/dehydratase family protein [Pararoseomonas indoligenes]MBP0492627.1 NAD-dependent epimerase/dehydratase family protein [Pararoseomonas indoligenes]